MRGGDLPADWERLYVRAPGINDFARVPASDGSEGFCVLIDWWDFM